MREVEAKFRVGGAEALVLALKVRGIEPGPAVVQDDQAYAPVGWRYGESKLGVSFARLRTVAGRHTFTVKRPGENELSCEEYESQVTDRVQMHQAILAMGFWPTVRIVKTRRVCVEGDLTICVDEVEHAGTFLELERVVPLGTPGGRVQAELSGFVEELGIQAERVQETYDSLVRAALT